MQTIVGPVPGHTMMAESSNRVVFSVTYGDLPAGVITSQNVNQSLDGACEGMVAAIHAKMTHKRSITLGKLPGREIRFTVTPPGASEMGVGLSRVFLDGSRFYQMLVLGGKSKFDEPAALAFCDSFQIGDATNVETPPPAKGVPTPIAGQSGGQTPWGRVVNASDTTIVRVEESAATMDLAGRNYTLGPEPNQQDAPRIMRPVTGDFTATVRVVDKDDPGHSPAAGARLPFHGAGLVLMGKGGEIIRLERAAFRRNGNLQRYVLFEQHVIGTPVNRQNITDGGGPVTLKLERRGTQVHASFSEDGKTWRTFGANNSTISAGEVGVSALNTSSLPYLACFEDFHVESK